MKAPALCHPAPLATPRIHHKIPNAEKNREAFIAIIEFGDEISFNPFKKRPISL
jgi:hypothetical protein